MNETTSFDLMSIRIFCLSALFAPTLSAFPPAPPVTTFGKVRGTFGFGVTDGLTELLLLADGKEVSRTKISESGRFGENYRLTLPVDLNPEKGTYRISAITPDKAVTYSFAAERNGKRIPVSKVETVVVKSNETIPSAASVRRIDFTLGADIDGDGLPDDWERYQASLLDQIDGDPLDLFSDKGDYDKDGLSDRGEYIAGTFALLFEDGLNFKMHEVFEDRRAELSFMSVDGKSYQIESTSDFKTWSKVEFSIPEDPVRATYVHASENTKRQRVIVEPPSGDAKVFYRLLVD